MIRTDKDKEAFHQSMAASQASYKEPIKPTKQDKIEDLYLVKEALIKQYIGVVNKPRSYFVQLNKLEQEITALKAGKEAKPINEYRFGTAYDDAEERLKQ